MTPVAVLVGDLRDPRCGVGASVGALIDGLDQPVVVLDPTVKARVLRRRARDAAASCRGLVIVYPTRSTLQQPRMALSALIARLAFRGRWVRVYLHELRWFHRVHRALVEPALRLATDRIVVSHVIEARTARAAGLGLFARGIDIVVAPPVNGAAPTPAQVRAAIEEASTDARALRCRTAGVFGMLRPDKGPDWLVAHLRTLEARFDRLVIVGSGWEGFTLPADLAARFEVVRAGHVDDADLPRWFAEWGVAIATYWDDGAHDGRMSLRTPLAYGVPTATPAPQAGQLTLAPRHLVLVSGAAVPAIAELSDAERRAGADEVAAFEAACAGKLAEVLFA